LVSNDVHGELKIILDENAKQRLTQRSTRERLTEDELTSSTVDRGSLCHRRQHALRYSSASSSVARDSYVNCPEHV